MICKICEAKTHRMVKGTPICRNCISTSKEIRDDHNNRMKKEHEGLFMALPIAGRFVKNDNRIDRIRVNQAYTLDRMFQEKNDEN